MRGGSYNAYSTAWLSSHPPEQVVISAIVCKTMGQEIVFLSFKVFRTPLANQEVSQFLAVASLCYRLIVLQNILKSV
jgi:hypothetical protein